ncbi:MAG: TonB-dependent receptor [Rhodospirillaceae bacterium]|jgi:iron complex outermembrane recepter protein|nr:TonB-dependent receptor [Rhodospirillaceae bacterium]
MLKRTLFTTSIIFTGLLVSLGASDEALAQRAELSISLEEIVVTAQRRENSLQSVPIPVSAFSRQTLENRQISQAADLERYVPSMKMRNNITQPTNLSPSMRGSTQQDASLVVAESPFGIYVDDVYLGRMNGNNVQLADFERVEVLRGPQGTLYGRNTLAGAIKFITRTPSEDNTWLNGEVGYGRYQAYRASVSAGGGVSDGLGASIALQKNGRNGVWNNIATGQRIGDEKNFAGRVKLNYTGSETFSAIASLSYTDSDNDALQLVNMTTPNVPSNKQFRSSDLVPVNGSIYTINRPLRPRSPAPAEDETRGETKQLIASLTMSYEFGNATLKSITALVDTDDFFNTDFRGNGAVMAGTNANASQFTQEIQIQGTAIEDRLNYIAGVFYMDESADQQFGWQFLTPSSTSDIDITTESISAFGQLDYALTDAFKVTAGVRYTEDQKDFDMSINVLPTSIVPAFLGNGPPVSLSNKYTAWTPKFGVDYTVPTSGGVIDSMLLYASASRGFKSGGYSAIAIFNLNDAQTPYGPETNWTYEAGFKTDLADNRLRVNASYFYNEISDLTLNSSVTDPVSGTISFPVQNAGEATIKGLETEIVAIPAEGLNLFANMAFLSGKFSNLNPTSAAALALVNYGTAAKPPQVPDYTFTVGFDYGVDFSLGNNDARFSFGADWYSTDDFITASTNDFVLDGYDRVNGFVALGIDTAWELRFAIKNLTDERTISTGSRGLGGFLALRPTEYMFSVKYSM